MSEEKKLTDEAINATVKSLKWVCNQIPNDLGNSNEEKMLKAIQLYCQQGIAVIERLQGENADLKKLVKSLEEVKATLLEERKVQKAEIERLTEELATAKQELVNEQRYYENAYSKACQLETQNAELQKQVDELKATLHKSKQDMMVFHGNAVKQAVKDTAKEILQGLNKWLKQAISDSYEIAVLNSGGFHGGRNRAFHEVKDLVKKVAKSKGVEVE